LIIGFIAGWLAGQVVKGTGFGLENFVRLFRAAATGSWPPERPDTKCATIRHPCAEDRRRRAECWLPP